MAEFPSGFLPDLRDLRSWPGLDDTLWREPYLVEETYGQLYRVVRSHLDPPVDVLDLGCGLGYMPLELAREGCRVVAIDADGESIALARKAHDADPGLRDRGLVSYEVADITDWDVPPASFDLVVVSRVFHHVPNLGDAMDKMKEWLRPGGKLVSIEFAYDRFDRPCATWLYQTQGLLQASGASASNDRLGNAAESQIEQIWRSWWHDHEDEHELNTFDELTGSFRRTFNETHFGWLPYLYWEALIGLDLPADRGAAVARFLRILEEHLIAEEELPSVLFTWVGQRADVAG